MKAFLQLAIVTCLLVCVYGTSSTSDNTTVIPLSMLRNSGMLNAMKSSSEFAEYLFRDFDQNPANRYRTGVDIDYGNNVARIGSGSLASVERSATTLQHAGCQPYEQVVPLANSAPHIIMYPSCVLAKQCGGCCGHPALECRPAGVKQKLVQVAKYIYDGTSMHPDEKIDYIAVEEHTSCECMCKVQESDCNPSLHTFDQAECQCKCRNSEQSGSCPGNKRWNSDICACQCSSTINCGSGYTYNLDTCLCDAVIARGGDAPNTSNNNVQEQPLSPGATSDEDVCGHLRCPRRYKPAARAGGGCGCVYNRRNRG